MSELMLPLYERTRRQVQALIEKTCKPGDLLPTQGQLAARFGTSLITVKRAIQEMAREGLVESHRGRGTIVKMKGATGAPSAVSSWTDSISGLGGIPRTSWVRFVREFPTPEVRRLLDLKARQPVVRIERLRCIDTRPVCLMTNVIPAGLVPGLEATGLMSESLYADLASRFRIVPSHASESVTARKVADNERAQLGRDARLVLVIDRLTRCVDNSPMEWARVVARCDRYEYHVQLINKKKST